MRQRAVDLGLDVVPQDGDGEMAGQQVIDVDGEDTSSDGDLYDDRPAAEKRAAAAGVSAGTVFDGDRGPKAERNKITRSRTEQIIRQENSSQAGGSPRLSRSVGNSPVSTHKESSFFPGYSNVRDSSRLVRRKLIDDLPPAGNDDDETVDAGHDEESGQQRASSPTEDDSNYSMLKRSGSSRRLTMAATAVQHASRLRKKRTHTAGGLPEVDATSLWLKLDTMGVWFDHPS